MDFRQASLEETEEILKKCNHCLYVKLLKLVEYVQDNFETVTSPIARERKQIFAKSNKKQTGTKEEDQGKGLKEKQKEKKKCNENDRTDTEVDTDTEKGTDTDTAGSSYAGTEKGKAKGKGRRRGKPKEDKAKIGIQNITNFFKVVETKKEYKGNEDKGNDSPETFLIGGVNANIKKYAPLVNVFFFYGHFNVIIIIYFLLYKTNIINSYLYVNEDVDNNEEYIVYNNRKLIHIFCTRLNECGLSTVNKIIEDLIVNKINSFKVFIFENFDCLNITYKKIFMNNLNKSKNLIFIHSTFCNNDVFLSNCLYMRIPKPNETLFYSYILERMQTKYNIEIYEDKKNSVLYILKQCNFDFTLILTVIYFLQINNAPDFSKLLKLVVNSNLKKLITVIQKGSVTNSSMFLIRNILYNIIDSYFPQIQTFLNQFCKELLLYHRNDDEEYRKQIYFLFSDYSIYATLTENPIVVLENLCSKLILIEKKFAHSLKGKDEIEKCSHDELSTSTLSKGDESQQ